MSAPLSSMLIPTASAKRALKTVQRASDQTQTSAYHALIMKFSTTTSASTHAQNRSTPTETTHVSHVTLHVQHATDQTVINA